MSELNVDAMLMHAIDNNASDLHLKAGLPPILRKNGRLCPLTEYESISPEQMKNIAFNLMNDRQKADFKKELQIDLGYSISGVGRFRVNIFLQRGAVGIVFRVIPATIKNFESLHLPPVLEKLALEMRGLVLVTGITGSGKSTTLSAIVDYINNTRSCHIITIEDPIEYTHKDNKSVISQREIGVDTVDFSSALRGALRQDPDVILVGEMRDLETIQTALVAAETGHLVLSTLHTTDATETISRIISVFPPYHQKQIRIQLAETMKGIISQRLMPTMDGKERVPAVEILVTNARVRSCIVDKEKTKDLADVIYKGHSTFGMQTFDQSIMYLMQKGLISGDEAMRQASNPDDFALRAKGGISSTTDTGWDEYSDNLKNESDGANKIIPGDGIDEDTEDDGRF